MQENKNSIEGRVLSVRETGSGGPESTLKLSSTNLTPSSTLQRLCQSIDQRMQGTKDARVDIEQHQVPDS